MDGDAHDTTHSLHEHILCPSLLVLHQGSFTYLAIDVPCISISDIFYNRRLGVCNVCFVIAVYGYPVCVLVFMRLSAPPDPSGVFRGRKFEKSCVELGFASR